jgi:TIR domain
MAHTVFICHSSKDKLVADAACAALEARRIPCWIAPRDVLGGTEYMEELDEALANSQIVLLIFSQKANDSPQVRREIERSVSYEKIILPFRIEDALPTRAMKFALSNTHWLDAINPPMEGRLSDLCDTVLRLIERKGTVVPLWQQIETVVESSVVVPEQVPKTIEPKSEPIKPKSEPISERIPEQISERAAVETSDTVNTSWSLFREGFPGGGGELWPPWSWLLLLPRRCSFCYPGLCAHCKAMEGRSIQ